MRLLTLLFLSLSIPVSAAQKPSPALLKAQNEAKQAKAELARLKKAAQSEITRLQALVPKEFVTVRGFKFEKPMDPSLLFLILVIEGGNLVQLDLLRQVDLKITDAEGKVYFPPVEVKKP